MFQLFREGIVQSYRQPQPLALPAWEFPLLLVGLLQEVGSAPHVGKLYLPALLVQIEAYWVNPDERHSNDYEIRLPRSSSNPQKRTLLERAMGARSGAPGSLQGADPAGPGHRPTQGSASARLSG